MTVVPLAVEVTSVCLLAGYLLHYYGNWKKQHIMVTVAAFISWYFSLLILFTLPIDVSNTFYRQCVKDHSESTSIPPTFTPAFNFTTTATTPNLSDSQFTENLDDFTTEGVVGENSDENTPCKKPWSWVPEHVLPTLWQVVYWTSQVLTWLLIPLMQAYARAGDFTVIGKLKTALIENAIFYGTYLLIFGICLIYIAVRPDIQVDGPSLKVLAITASNTWGLTLLVLMWGYGLVEVPRKLWHSSYRGHMLKYNYFKIAKLSVEKTEAEENLEDVLEDVKRAAETIKYNNPLRKHVETILEKCPEATREQVMRTTREDYQDFNNPTDTPTEKSLVRLHKKVIDTSQVHQRTQCQWHRFTGRALELEDVAMSEVSAHRVFRRSHPYTGCFQSCYSAKLEWYWKCMVYPWGMRLLAVIVILMSVMVVWSECFFFIADPVLSLFAIFVNTAADAQNYFAIEFICFATIAYLSVCAYFTVFKVRFFNYYYLAGHHQTNEYSLLFCGMMMCRLTPPLCLNFLGLIHLDSHITQKQDVEETYFTQIMGHMDVIKFISSGFNIYFPIAIVLLCIATFFNLCSRALHCMGFEQFIGDDDMTSDLIDEGKNLITRERRKQERLEEGAARRRDWNDRYAAHRANRGTELPDPSSDLSTSHARPSEYGSNRPVDDPMHARNRSGAATSGASSHVVVKNSSAPAASVSTTGRASQNASSDGAPPRRGLRKLFGGGGGSDASKKKNAAPKKDDAVGASEKKDQKNEKAGAGPVYSVSDGKTTTARSPQESDRSELLREVEPMGYSSTPAHDPFSDDPFQEDDLAVHTGGGYQSRAAARPTSLNTGARNPSRAARGPPRGIFDDI